MSKTCEPDGVVMMLIAPDGRVVSTVTDFERSGYGGFSLQRAQEIRCKNKLATEVLDTHCATIIVKAASGYHAEAIVDSMRDNHGYVLHTEIIGHLPKEKDNG